MIFDSDIEQSDAESIGSWAHMCETELDEDHEELYLKIQKDPIWRNPWQTMNG